MLSLRLPGAEFRALLAAARDAGEPVSQYVRKAIRMRQSSGSAPIAVTLSYSVAGMPNKVELDQWSTWTTGAQEATLTTDQ